MSVRGEIIEPHRKLEGRSVIVEADQRLKLKYSSIMWVKIFLNISLPTLFFL